MMSTSANLKTVFTLDINRKIPLYILKCVF